MLKIQVGARSSPLSVAQIDEVEEEVKRFNPTVVFERKLLMTTGDFDRTTSLRTMGKTDFFTKEIDAALLREEVDIAIHSAKDLPDPLPEGLSIYAITRGVDSRDSLVLHHPYTLSTLKNKARVGVSSLRREEYLSSLRSDLRFVDIRGTIQERLSLWEKGEIDALVLAEAALIRLHLTHLHREILSAPTAPFQGRLAIVGRKGSALETLFQSIDTRNLL